MDCFASLAMTWRGRYALNIRTREHDGLDCTNALASLADRELIPHVAALLSK
jgi:hypothetical protein